MVLCCENVSGRLLLLKGALIAIWSSSISSVPLSNTEYLCRDLISHALKDPFFLNAL